MKIRDLRQSRTGKTSDFKFGSVWANALLQPPLSMLSEVASPLVYSRATNLSPSWGTGLVQTEWIRKNRDIIRTFSRHIRKRLRFDKYLSCNCIRNISKTLCMSNRTASRPLHDILRTKPNESLRNRLGMANKEIRAITHYDRHQVVRLMRELRKENTRIESCGHGKGARYVWK